MFLKRSMSTIAQLILVLMAALPTSSQTAPAKKPITHEAIWLMKRVGAPVVSPDGKWIVFSVVEPAYDEKEQVSDLWIVPTDLGTKSRRLTFSKGAESGTTWGPDSRRIAFSTKREGDEVSQIYLMEITGGEAQRITSLSTGARSPSFSPDGRVLLFTSNVYPNTDDDDANKKIAAERKARKYKARVYEKFPVRYWDHWLEETQPHLFLQSLEPGARARDLLAGTTLVNARGFAGRDASANEELDAQWSPNGASVLFNATTQKDSAAYANYPVDIFQVSVSGGEPKRLTAGDGNYTGAVFSPDGKTLFCQFTPDAEKVYNLTRIAAFNWQSNTFSGKPQIITASFDRSIEGFAIVPDSRTIYLLAEDAGLVRLYSVSATGGEVTPALETTSGVYTNLVIPEKASRTMIFANWDSAINPPEIYRLNLSQNQRQKPEQREALTDFTTQASAMIDWQSLRSFWFTSKAGKRIHSMVALPPAFDEARKYPLLVVMHGGPYSMWRDSFGIRWNYHLLAQPGYVVLLTNYTGSTGFGERFAQEIQGDPFAGPGTEINEAADEAIRLFKYVDGTRQAAAGASYGGHLANWMQATTTRYKCLISHAGLINLESQWGTSDTIYSREVTNGGPVWEQGGVWRTQNPIRYAKDFRTPILLTVGENDFRVPINQTLENWSVLQRLKIPSRLIIFPEENHWILKPEDNRYFYSEVFNWLAKYLK